MWLLTNLKVINAADRGGEHVCCGIEPLTHVGDDCRERYRSMGSGLNMATARSVHVEGHFLFEFICIDDK